MLAAFLLLQHCGPFAPYGYERGGDGSVWANGLWRVRSRDGYEFLERGVARGVVPRVEIEDQFYRPCFFPHARGFLVAGCPRVGYPTRDGLVPDDRWIAASYSPDGRRLHAYLSRTLLRPEEFVLGGSCGDVKPENACFRYGDFAERPALSKDGTRVEFLAAGTKRPVAIWLSLGLAVDETLTKTLAAWLNAKESFDSLVPELDVDDPERREKASDTLLGLGPRAIPTLRAALKTLPTGEGRARATLLLRDLELWLPGGGTSPPNDLRFLRSLRHYPDAGVVQAADRRLRAICPRLPEEGVDEWIDGGKVDLWDEARQIWTSRK